jgi:phosphoglycerol transferase
MRVVRTAPWVREALFAAGAALLALVVAAWALQLWNAHAQVPLRYSDADDTMFYISVIKGILDHGWLLSNHNLGAPFGQKLLDFPQTGDDLNWLEVAGLALITGKVGPTINGFFLLTFPLDAAVAYFVLRRLGARRPSAVVCSVLFALLPYHFFRSDSHLMLSSYYALPLVAYLFVAIVQGELPRRRELAVMCLVIASTGLYYAVFGIALLAAATLLAALARRSRAAIAAGALVTGAVLMVLALNLSPTLAYQAGHGANPVVTRSAGAGDDLAMSASYLLLPPVNDRIGPLASLTRHYASQTPPHGYCEQCYESIGTVGDVGFAWLAVLALAGLIGAPLALGTAAGVYRAAAAGIAACLALGVSSGLSSLARVFLTADIRAWNRVSVLIAFFSLLAAALLLDAAGARAGPRWGRVLAVVVLLFGIADQTSPAFVPDYARDAAEYRSDATFVNAIERRLPAGASVFELPYVLFPEGYQPFMAPDQTLPYAPSIDFEYDLARPYIHSTGLSWSYGAMKGRATDYAAQLAAKPVDLVLAGAVAAGFDGLVVDQAGYPGPLAGELRRELRALLRVTPIRSPVSTLLFYDLRPYARRLRAAHTAAQMAALRSATLDPLALSCQGSRLRVTNPGRRAAAAVLSAAVVHRRPLRFRLTLPPGTTHVTAAELGERGATLVAPTVTQQAFEAFAGNVTPAIHAGVVGPPCADVKF